MRRAPLVVIGVLLVFVVAVTVVAVLDRAPGAEPDTIDRLRYTSVVVAPGAEELLDPDRARRIIGDRPIVAIAGNVGVTCDDVADALPELIVLVAGTEPPLDDCGGNASRWHPDLLREARAAVPEPGAGRDRSAYVAAYARAFDARVEPGTAPPRREPPQPATDGEAAQLVVLVVVISAVFLLVVGYLVHQVRSAGRQAGLLRRRWHARANARLNRLADRIMRVDDPGRTPAERAAIAKDYVLLLRDFEAATTDVAQGSVNWQLRMLEEKAGLTTKRPRARAAGTKAPEAASWAEARRAARARRVELRREEAERRRELAQRQADEQIVEARRDRKRRREAKERRRRRNKRGRRR